MINFFKKDTFNDGTIISGLTNELTIFYMLSYFKDSNENVIVVTNTLYEANQVYNNLITYSNDVLLFPMDDFLTSVALAVSPELKLKRLETLEKIDTQKHIIVTNLMGYLKFNANVKEKNNNQLSLKVNQIISREILLDKLETLGYKRDSMVTMTGEYAVRGFVIDVFLSFYEHPIRIEFFGDTIESIRFFDENTQRSLSPVVEVSIKAIDEVETKENSSLLDYLPTATVIKLNPQQILVGYHKLYEEMQAYNERENLQNTKHFFNLEDLHPKKEIEINTIENATLSSKALKFHSKEMTLFHGNFNLLKDSVNHYLREGKTVVFMLSKASQAKIISELFNHEVFLARDGNIKSQVINIIAKKMNHGFIFNDYVFISEFDIEDVKQEIKYKNNFRMGQKINSLEALKIGDYVVHISHGIGIYCGVKALTTMGLTKDYIQIQYHGNDKVYIPVEKISTIYKYSDAEGKKPELNKLNSPNWEKKKRSVLKKIKDISEDLIKLYAARQNIKVKPYQKLAEEDIFASEFTYEETKDQTRAIKDILNDLEKDIPMDRLLCGDVGFGKTEVAFRAMFKTVYNNGQVLYLCPTTILSKQQYENALERFKNYPVEIALLNRFTSVKETKRILLDLKSGKIDIVFGTHRLLSDDVNFKNLGLLIVDEEQRFGVTHKEKIKKYKNDVNVLTLSATPIPRTLKMALSGLRDLSIIDTPPVNRYPVQTYVVAENELIIKDAIYKELARDGQIFVLYNRVETIEEKVMNLQTLIPEAKIRFAHGQMNKIELENIMNDFIDHQFDILVSTTIIETGIDIPNANTLIIYDADHFGLSQLYQLRGRVGRSDKIAYAYFMYNKNKMLNDIAVKRLSAIRDFTELGSGYKIAMRDLSIRGAGDLLGSEQAGFVDTVGINLYMKMVEDEMKRLKGEEVEDEDSENDLPLIKVSTHIEDNYVADEDIKIAIHKRINEIDSEQTLKEVKEELIDRFGQITPDMEIYMYEEWFEKIANALNITQINQTKDLVSITIPENESNQIKGDKLFLEAYNINPKFQIQYLNKRIIIKLPIKQLDKHFLYYLVPLFSLIKSDLQV